jgi:putative tryptophan/tyrosine transport system substrate-binding protein
MFIKAWGKTNIILAVALSLVFVMACNSRAPGKIFTVGIIINIQKENHTLMGFKDGMKELGYIEGKNIKYVLREVNEMNEQDIDTGIKEVLAQNIDIIVTAGRDICLQGKELTKGLDTPLLFIGEPVPVENGLVERLAHPGGNITGVRCPDITSKAMEWLHLIIPNAKKFYVPYNPKDESSVAGLASINKTADQLGIKLILQEVHSVGEVLKRIEGMNEDFDALFMISSPTLNPASGEISQAAIKHGLPTGAPLPLDASIMMVFCNDWEGASKMTARMAHQIHQGVKAADFPVETAEVKLIINIKTAEKIGLNIPDVILNQASSIIR